MTVNITFPLMCCMFIPSFVMEAGCIATHVLCVCVFGFCAAVVNFIGDLPSIPGKSSTVCANYSDP